ncbi:MAG: biotin/lipoyl-binding protein [Gemmataceae bacterium]
MASNPTLTSPSRAAPPPPAEPRMSVPPVEQPVRRAARWPLWLALVGLTVLASTVTLVTANPQWLANPPQWLANIRGSSGEQATRPAVDSKWRPDVAIAHVDAASGIRSLYPAVPGRVVALPVPEGKVVDVGAVLLQIDDALPKLRLKEAKLDLEAAREKVKAAEQERVKHRYTVKMQEAAVDAALRQQEAGEAQFRKADRYFTERLGGNADDVESARRLVEVAKANVRAERAKLDLARAVDPDVAVRLAEVNVRAKQEEVEKAELGVKECQLLAPCKGKIIRRAVNVGEVLGTNPMRPAIEFCPDDGLIIRAEVEQEFAHKFKIGVAVEITDDATSKQLPCKGVVERVSDWYTQRRSVVFEPMPLNDIRTLEVIIRVTEYDAKADNPLRVNQRVRVRFAANNQAPAEAANNQAPEEAAKP